MIYKRISKDGYLKNSKDFFIVLEENGVRFLKNTSSTYWKPIFDIKYVNGIIIYEIGNFLVMVSTGGASFECTEFDKGEFMSLIGLDSYDT